MNLGSTKKDNISVASCSLEEYSVHNLELYSDKIFLKAS